MKYEIRMYTKTFYTYVVEADSLIEAESIASEQASPDEANAEDPSDEQEELHLAGAKRLPKGSRKPADLASDGAE